MIPLAIRITNFRSFKGCQTFVFPEAPGLYFLQGVNEVEPRLGPNGAGKSTVWDALCWLGFNKTPAGLKAGDVCNWEAGKGTEVAFDFIAPSGEECTTTRTWGPISWTLAWKHDSHVEDLTKAENNQVLGWLGLEFTAFLNSVLTAQRQPMFLDIDHNAQAALFSDVLGLDRWLDYSARASKKASAQDAVTRGLERELAALEGRLAEIGNRDFSRSAADWERARQLRVANIEADHIELGNKARRLKADVATAQQDEEVARAAVAKAQDAVNRVRDTQRTEGQTCPTCGQRTTAEEYSRELRNAEADHATVRTILGDCQRAVSGARRSYELNERELDRLEDKAEEITGEANPYADMEAKARRDADNLRDDIDDKRRLLDHSASRHSLLSYWVRGFKEIRLTQIAEALTELEVEVNSAVTELGLEGWELNFQVDRETKGGSIQRGFNTFVRSPYNARAVPWEAWSGGEAQRLRLAATMGLGDLIRSRTGATLPLEVWDEPTQGLSPQGAQDLLESLSRRARNEQRVIWLIDHRTYDFGGFAGGATVTKTAAGSVIEQY